MNKITVLLLCALLVCQGLGQNSTSTCSVSSLSNIATGIVLLGAPAESLAKTQYTVTFTGVNLGVFAELFPAFAIAGMQAASAQTFYSLVVDQISFSNGNTKMSFTMDYTYNQNGINYQTTWTKVKLSYVVVSSQFATTGAQYGNYIWAGSVGLNVPVQGIQNSPVLTNSIFLQDPSETDDQCGYLNQSPPRYDLTCGTLPSAAFVTHLYIMGFKFNPAGTYTLAASVLRNNGLQAVSDLDEAQEGFDTTGISQNGPLMTISSFGGQLQYIKVGIVITVIQDISNYPAVNSGPFVYSGVYMNYTLYNTAKPIVSVANTENIRFTDMLKAKYQIFGLSSFSINSLPSNVSVIDINLSLPDLNTALLQTDNTNYLSFVRVSADYWNNLIPSTCSSTSTNMLNVQQKLLTSVPVLEVNKQSIVETSSALTFQYTAFPQDALSDLSSTVVFTSTMFFEKFTPGMGYDFNIQIYELNPDDLNSGISFEYQVSIQGNIIVDQVVNSTDNVDTFPLDIGYIVSSATPSVTITLILPRPDNTLLQNTIYTTLVVTQYGAVFDPTTDCCTAKCPANSGLDTTSSPPSCISCGNSTGLVYNSVAGTCQCQTGYYSVTTPASTCYPCFAQLCQTCNSTTPTTCTACVTGATFNNQSLCACLTGFFQANGTCNACPAKCLTCQVASVCQQCSDNTTRSINNNCNCLAGFYDSGVSVCQPCGSLCVTCSNASTCDSCNATNNRSLVNGQCVCSTGFYQVINPDGSLTCAPCSPECTACQLTPQTCSNCDPNLNRILGYDSWGHQTCFCSPGYTQNSNGDCVQTNCNADPFCAECQTVLSRSVCIRCLASTNRILVLPDQKCLCQSGYYELNGICTECSSGCGVCSNATKCTQCVVSASDSRDGTCACPSGYYFMNQPIRYCKKCPTYCLTCLNGDQCTSCQTNFTLIGNTCACPLGRYINNGNCVPCASGCSTCNTTSSCQNCVNGLYLQNGSCVSRCSAGFYQDGQICSKCSENCAYCEQANLCTYCQSGRLAYNGFCYQNCPVGSVANANASSCVTCNNPCATCTDHPSKCTSCASGCGNLFNNECIKSCPVGTFANNGSCTYCAYTCATCLGTNTTCTSCPTNKILYNGQCYDQCPYVMIGGICTFNCAAGLYKVYPNQCLACSSQCKTCDVLPNNCTSCAKGFAYNGTCVQVCPNNTLALNGICSKCDPSCYGCINSYSNCINCAPGYVKCGSLCLTSCQSNQYVDNNNTCITCNASCRTCTNASFCTACANPQAVPVNGVCSSCAFPCNTCGASTSTCTSCVANFNLVGSSCLANCPTGSVSINGACQCKSGIFYLNQCVQTCPPGTSNIGGSCQNCGSNCAACSNSVNTCTSCLTGFQLDSVTSTCQPQATCQFGQYFSQSSNNCQRICPPSTFFYESVCLASCIDGYSDNGLGGCVATSPQTGCSSPYFLSNKVCISSCPAQTYPDSSSRVCSSCSTNCFSCLSSSFCYACVGGYDLVGGICVSAATPCPSGQYRYNGACYNTCPIGTCVKNSYCERNCPAGSYSYNSGCYRTCPTAYHTADACVATCPVGTSLVNGVCQNSAQSCQSGQYYDTTSSSCLACTYPCTACSLTAAYCTACATGLTLNNNQCVSSNSNCGANQYSNGYSCAPCPAKCQGCISATSCSGCASGYQFNGYDCVVQTSQLKKLTLSVVSVSKRDSTAFITLSLNIIPNGLTITQKSQFFLVVPNKGDNCVFINQWIDPSNPNQVIVAANYNPLPSQSALFFAVNAQILASAYSSIGYTADSSSFVSANINSGLPAAPASLVIPTNAINTVKNSISHVPSIIANKAGNKDTLA